MSQLEHDASPSADNPSSAQEQTAGDALLAVAHALVQMPIPTEVPVTTSVVPAEPDTTPVASTSQLTQTPAPPRTEHNTSPPPQLTRRQPSPPLPPIPLQGHSDEEIDAIRPSPRPVASRRR